MVRSKETLELQYTNLTPNSMDQWNRGRKFMPGGIIKGAYWQSPHPIYISSAKDCYVWDIDDRKYTDFVNHHTALILGHTPPNVINALAQSISNGIVYGAPVQSEAEISEEICRRIPSIEKIRFTNSGPEASLHATRLIRAATGKSKIAKFEGAYHGSHDALEISVSTRIDKSGSPQKPNSVPAWEGFAPDSSDNIIILPYHDETAVENILREHKNDLAGVFYEGIGGTQPVDIPPAFTRFVRKITSDLGLIMVMDEVVSFRMGYGGYQSVCGINPDLTILGKIIGGGLPVGALGGRADLMNILDNTQGRPRVSQSGTFSGHPMTLSAGLATLNDLTVDVYDYLNILGTRLREGLCSMFDELCTPCEVIQQGSIVAIYFTDKPVVDTRSKMDTDNELNELVTLSLLTKGYLVPQGLGLTLTSSMNDSHIDNLVAAIGETMIEND